MTELEREQALKRKAEKDKRRRIERHNREAFLVGAYGHCVVVGGLSVYYYCLWVYEVVHSGVVDHSFVGYMLVLPSVVVVGL